VKSNRLRAADLHHELKVEIAASADNPAAWDSCAIIDANLGARSDAFTPGVGRPLNANERATLAALDDSQEPGLRASYSEWSRLSGLKPDTWKSVRTRLLKAKLAEAIPTGKQTRTGGAAHAYGITDRGRQALASGLVSDTD
jgi:hypothetical protein